MQKRTFERLLDRLGGVSTMLQALSESPDVDQDLGSALGMLADEVEDVRNELFDALEAEKGEKLS